MKDVYTCPQWGWEHPLVRLINAHDLKVGAEVGVWIGDTVLRVLLYTKVTMHYGIDPWKTVEYESIKSNGSNMDAWAQLRAEKGQDWWEDIYRMCSGRLVPYAARCRLIRYRSPDAAEIFRNGSLDYVYIDGLHVNPQFKDDIFGWVTKVRKNGFLCGDDYDFNTFPDITNTVHDYFRSDLKSDGHMWYVQMKGGLSERCS